MESTPRNIVLTPCIKVCVIEAVSGLCAGCGRSLAEIGGWLGFSDAERRAVMAVLPARLAGLAAGDPLSEPAE
jgi:predicted Fe-S protein YdhL (DUF1289 family)